MISYRTPLILATSIAALIPNSSWAQNTDEISRSSAIQEIQVTAQRRSQSAQDIPLAITALKGESLQANGVFDTSDLATVVPNVQIFSPFGRTQPNISLRGISIANEFNANQTSPIGIYVDDAYMVSRISHGMQLYDLERVEVLRGPQGTLFGRNTTGGAMNMITKKPQLNGFSGELTAGFGNYGRRQASGAIDYTIIEDKLGIRIAGDYVNTDPMINNKSGAGDLQSEDATSGRITLISRPNDKLELMLKYYTGDSETDQVANHYLGIGPNETNPLTGYGRPKNLDFYEVETRQPGYYKSESDGVLATISYEISERYTLNFLTSYDWGERFFEHNADNEPSAVLDQRFDDEYTQFNQEVRLNFEFDSFSGIVGVYYGKDDFKENLQEKEFLYFLEDIIPFNFPNSGFGVRQRSKQERTSKAIFSQIDWEVAEALTVTLGLRYTEDEIRFKSNANILDYNNNAVYNSVPDFGAYDPKAFLHRSDDDSSVSGRLGISYELNEDTLLFASYSRGYRAGAINGGGYLSPNQVTIVEPEEVDAYEAGLKTYFLDKTLRTNVSTFYYKYENQQLVEVVADSQLLRNAPKATIYGLEGEFLWSPSTAFDLNANVGLLNAEYDGLVLSGQNLDGNKLPFAPELTFNIGANWAFAEFGRYLASFNTNVSYTTKQWFSPFNGHASSATDVTTNKRLKQDAYTLVNASLSLASDRFEFRIWGKNVFNEEYHIYGIDLREAFGYDYLATGTPRTFGFTASTRF